MKLIFEYGKQRFTAELSDTNRNARLALNLAWDLVDDKTKLVFMPDFNEMKKPKAIFEYKEKNI